MTPGCEVAVGHYRRIFGLKYHPDDVHVFITAGWDNVMRVSVVTELAYPIFSCAYEMRVYNRKIV